MRRSLNAAGSPAVAKSVICRLVNFVTSPRLDDDRARLVAELSTLIVHPDGVENHGNDHIGALANAVAQLADHDFDETFAFLALQMAVFRINENDPVLVPPDVAQEHAPPVLQGVAPPVLQGVAPPVLQGVAPPAQVAGIQQVGSGETNSTLSSGNLLVGNDPVVDNLALVQAHDNDGNGHNDDETLETNPQQD